MCGARCCNYWLSNKYTERKAYWAFRNSQKRQQSFLLTNPRPIDPTGDPAAWLSDLDEVILKCKQEIAAGTIQSDCRATKSRVHPRR